MIRRGWQQRTAVGVTMLVVACCGLTTAQRKGVSDFSKAATGYSAVPGAALQSFYDLHEAVAVLNASTAFVRNASEADAAFKELQAGFRFEGKVRPAALRVVKGLSLIDTYAAGLSTLITDESDSLDKDALAVGKSLDSAYSEYNSLVAATGAPGAGAAVASFAGIARSVGGVLVSTRQAAYLKKFVNEADKVIPLVAEDVKTLMTDVLMPVGIAPDEKTIKADFDAHFTWIGLPANAPKISAADVTQFASALQKAREARAQMQKAIDASAALASAHAELVKAVNAPEAANSVEEQITNLVGQIKAGQKVVGELESDGGSTADAGADQDAGSH